MAWGSKEIDQIREEMRHYQFSPEEMCFILDVKLEHFTRWMAGEEPPGPAQTKIFAAIFELKKKRVGPPIPPEAEAS